MYQTRGPIFPIRERAIATRSGPPARPRRTGAGTPGSENGQLPVGRIPGLARDFDLFDAGFDALVAPTSPDVAFRFGAKLADPVKMYLSDACTLPVNMAGLPGISIPCGLSEGLPVGLQIVAARFRDLRVLQASRAFEQARPWAQGRPPL